MRKAQVLLSVLLLVSLLLVACAPAASPAPAPQALAPAALAPAAPAPVGTAQDAAWNAMVEAAKREGMIILSTTAGADNARAVAAGFKNRFGLKVELINGQSSALAAKMMMERRAGLYLEDVYFGGSTTATTIYKPGGILEPLEPALVLAEATDPKAWWKGELGWLDKGHLLVTTLAEPENVFGFNTNVVQPGELKSYKDLLNPKWKGKMTLRDPSVNGGPAKWFQSRLMAGYVTEDYMRQLAKQDVVIMRDNRLQTEWLAQGKYPIVILPDAQSFEPFVKLGIPITAAIPAEGTHLSSGSSGLGLLKNAPYPNAAKVFANWFLSKEGQTVLSVSYNSPSRRLDVPTDHLRPSQLMQPGVKYFEYDKEEIQLEASKYQKLAKEIFNIQ